MNEEKTWSHSRKGIITGRIVHEWDEFCEIEATRDLNLEKFNGYSYEVKKGEKITVRKSFLTEM